MRLLAESKLEDNERFLSAILPTIINEKDRELYVCVRGGGDGDGAILIT